MPRLSTRAFVALVVIGLILQFSMLRMRGTGDVLIFKEWAVTQQVRGLFRAYEPQPDDPHWLRPDYPPLSLIMLWATSDALDRMNGVDNDLAPASRDLTVVVKLPALATRVGITFLILWLVRRRLADDELARGAAALFWLNPALVLNGPALGYLDATCWGLGVIGLLLAGRERYGASAACGAAAMMFKPQGVFFLFVIGIASTQSRDRLARSTAAAGAVIVGLFAPFVWASGAANVWTGLRANFTEDMVSGNALNFWWIVTGFARIFRYGSDVLEKWTMLLSLDRFSAGIGFNPRPLMAVLVVIASLIVAWRARRDATTVRLAAALALIVHIYFTFAIAVHENHLVYAIVPLGLVAITRPDYRWIFWWVTAFSAANMLLFNGLGRDLSGPARIAWFLPVSMALSIGGLVILAGHAAAFHRLTRRGRT
jgi:Gpi18-like mannosyltransferase